MITHTELSKHDSRIRLTAIDIDTLSLALQTERQAHNARIRQTYVDDWVQIHDSAIVLRDRLCRLVKTLESL